jgi:hypothetical protein
MFMLSPVKKTKQNQPGTGGSKGQTTEGQGDTSAP